jgi:hypothetical protein
VLPQPHAYVTAVRDPTDVVGRRIAALVIDWGIALVMFVALAFGLAQTREFTTSSRAESVCNSINDVGDRICVPFDTTVYVYDGGDLAAIFLLPLAYQFVNDALLTGVTGFSIGKGLVGLRVIRQSDGARCGIGRATLRWLLWAADAFPYCLPLVGLITGLTTKGHRRVGDLAAGTLVVDKRDVGTVPVVPGLTAPTPPPWGYAPSWGQPPPQQPPAWGGYPTQPPGWGQQPAQPPAWGQPPPQPAWPPPSPQQPPTFAPAPGPSEPAPAAGRAGVDHPMWDDARDTYIQWDPDLSAWVQWDDSAKEWHRIV